MVHQAVGIDDDGSSWGKFTAEKKRATELARALRNGSQWRRPNPAVLASLVRPLADAKTLFRTATELGVALLCPAANAELHRRPCLCFTRTAVPLDRLFGSAAGPLGRKKEVYVRNITPRSDTCCLLVGGLLWYY